jgi:formate hydrogenlyase subunit 3/multisubunit Na+/H+ antiporter MnhD subunit
MRSIRGHGWVVLAFFFILVATLLQETDPDGWTFADVLDSGSSPLAVLLLVFALLSMAVIVLGRNQEAGTRGVDVFLVLVLLVLVVAWILVPDPTPTQRAALVYQAGGGPPPLVWQVHHEWMEFVALVGSVGSFMSAVRSNTMARQRGYDQYQIE